VQRSEAAKRKPMVRSGIETTNSLILLRLYAFASLRLKNSFSHLSAADAKYIDLKTNFA
jgi:alanine racemase